MTAPAAASLLAGADGPHGLHERVDQGWDQWLRSRAAEDPDALTRGRHAAIAAGQPIEAGGR